MAIAWLSLPHIPGQTAVGVISNWQTGDILIGRLQRSTRHWPFGKYKGQPLAMVARDNVYCAWFIGSAYARMNRELASDLGLAQQTAAASKTAMAAVEICDGGCTIYRPAVWRSRADT